MQSLCYMLLFKFKLWIRMFYFQILTLSFAYLYIWCYREICKILNPLSFKGNLKLKYIRDQVWWWWWFTEQPSCCKKTFLPFCTTEEGKVPFPLARLEGNILVHLCRFYGNRAGLMSGDSVCDLCGSLAECINPTKHTTIIPCSPTRWKTRATCQQNKKSPQAR